MKKTWFLPILAILIFLAITNPSRDDYKNWLLEQGRKENKADTNTTQTAMDNIFTLGAIALLDSIFVRRNYTLFSIYASTLNGRIMTIGVLGNFVDISDFNFYLK